MDKISSEDYFLLYQVHETEHIQCTFMRNMNQNLYATKFQVGLWFFINFHLGQYILPHHIIHLLA